MIDSALIADLATAHQDTTLGDIVDLIGLDKMTADALIQEPACGVPYVQGLAMGVLIANELAMRGAFSVPDADEFLRQALSAPVDYIIDSDPGDEQEEDE